MKPRPLKKSVGKEVSRRTYGYYSTNRSSYTPGQQVTIECVSDRELFDMLTGRLVFRVDITFGTATGTNLYLPQWGAGHFFSEMRIKTLSGTQIGDSLKYYGGYQRMVKNQRHGTNAKEGELSITEAANGITFDKATYDGLTVSYEFAHKIEGHIFDLSTYYPGHLHKGFIIELDVAPISQIFYGDNAADVASISSVVVKDIEFNCDLVRLDAATEAEMMRLRAEGKLYVDFSQPISENYAYSTGSTLNIEQIGVNGRVKNSKAFCVLDANRGTTAGYWNLLSVNGLTAYRFFVMKKPVNHRKIDIAVTEGSASANYRLAKQQLELKKAFEDHVLPENLTTHNVTKANIDTNNFIVGVKIQKGNEKQSPGFITSEVDNTRNNVRLEMDLSSASAAEYYLITEVDKRIQLLSGGVVASVNI